MKELEVYQYVIIIGLIAIFMVLFYFYVRLLTKLYLNKHKSQIINKNQTEATKYTELGYFLADNFSKFTSCIYNMGLNKTHYCSNAVLSNASNNPAKYVIKYSNIDKLPECLSDLKFCSQFLGNFDNLQTTMKDTYRCVKKDIPFWVRIFQNKKNITSIVCDVDKSLFKIKYYEFDFYYRSPAGRSYSDIAIVVDKELIDEIIGIKSYSLQKGIHASAQRSAMTKDLREAIKKRDNYTCCICGNSVYDEPNLLLEVDHIIPISKGGKTEAANLQTLCWKCNRTKSDNY